jgi:hypothetical protein
MTLMQAPSTVATGSQLKLLSGTTYTVDSNGFISVTSQTDFNALVVLGFLPAWSGRLNFTATVDPASGNDTSQDFAVGSLWRNSGVSPSRWWVCDNPALGAAVWNQISVGTGQANAGSSQFINLVLTGLLTNSLTTGITAFSGGGQGSATLLTGIFNNITVSAASSPPYDSVKLEPVALGSEQTAYNSSANPIQLFGTSPDTINGFATGTGITIPAGGIFTARGLAANKAVGTLPGMGFTTNEVYNTNTATSGTTLTGANISGAINGVTLAMTGTLGGGANAQLPTVANLLAAIPNPVTGYSYRFTLINLSSANFAWTITTNTTWTLNGTMSVAQNTWRDFILTITGATTGTLQSVRTGTIS